MKLFKELKSVVLRHKMCGKILSFKGLVNDNRQEIEELVESGLYDIVSVVGRM